MYVESGIDHGFLLKSLDAYEEHLARANEGVDPTEAIKLGLVHRHVDQAEGDIILAVEVGGYALLTEEDSETLKLDTIYVDEHARGNKAGSLLMSHVIDTAKEFGYSQLTSKVHNERVLESMRVVGDAALSFSLKNGATGEERPLDLTPTQAIEVFQRYREDHPQWGESDPLPISVHVTAAL